MPDTRSPAPDCQSRQRWEVSSRTAPQRSAAPRSVSCMDDAVLSRAPARPAFADAIAPDARSPSDDAPSLARSQADGSSSEAEVPDAASSRPS